MNGIKKEFEYTKCNICDSKDFVSITTILENKSNIYLAICKKCGLAYLNPRWTKIKYNKYYEAEYDSQYRPGMDSNSFEIESPKINVILERFREVKLLSNKPLRILDIGSGEGENLLAFSETLQGCQLYAIESSIIACEILKKNNIRIISNDVDSDWDEKFQNFFDIIILRHVLEHFLDPSSALKKIHATLKEKGVVYIAVPNNLLVSRNNGWLRIAHTYYFNKFSLTNILNKGKFNVISLREGDQHNSFEIFTFANKNGVYKDVEISSEYFRLQKGVFDLVLKKSNNVITFLKQIILQAKYKLLERFVRKKQSADMPQIDNMPKTDDVSQADDMPQVILRHPHSKAPTIFHVSAFSYGNAGDTLLPVALRDLWHEHQPQINWISQPVYPIVDEALVKKINQSKGIVIGGAGLFLKDTNRNDVSGWVWPCSVEMLNKIDVPVVLFAIGYNRFRGQDDFESVFADNINAFAERSVYVGLRNHGSIESLKKYLPENLHHKLVYQPCMTTFLKRLYPDVANYNVKEDFFVLNCAFDRSHLRFGQNIGQILSDVAIVCKAISKHLPLKYYSHMQADQAILPFLQSYGVQYELVDLQYVHPRQTIEEYAKPKLVLGMRGHAQMIPFGCNTPIVSIVSHNKMQWFLDDIGQPEWGADVLSDNFRQELLDRSFSILNNYQLTMELINSKMEYLYAISLNNTKIALNKFITSS